MVFVPTAGIFLKPTSFVPSTVQLLRFPDVGVPRTGVTRVGDVAKTKAPEPVSPVTAAARFVDDGVARKVATFVPSPDTPVAIGNPVQFVRVPDVGVPRMGVARVGDVAKTNEPVPVSSVTAARKFEEEGVPSQVATPVPNDVIPVPPLATARVPARVIVPELVTGPPEVVKPVVPPETSTEVTVPDVVVIATPPTVAPEGKLSIAFVTSVPLL